MMRLAVLISGNGSNLQALIDACDQGILDAKIAVVVSNKAKAFGLERAQRAGIACLVHSSKSYRQQPQWRESYDADLAKKLRAYDVDLVVLAGWMHILGARFLEQASHQVVNLHPALPGQFPGAHAIEDAYQAFCRGEIKSTGVMVHWVVPQVDAGEPIVVATVQMHATESKAALTERMHKVEHALIVAAIDAIGAPVVDGTHNRYDAETNT